MIAPRGTPFESEPEIPAGSLGFGPGSSVLVRDEDSPVGHDSRTDGSDSVGSGSDLVGSGVDSVGSGVDSVEGGGVTSGRSGVGEGKSEAGGSSGSWNVVSGGGGGNTVSCRLYKVPCRNRLLTSYQTLKYCGPGVVCALAGAVPDEYLLRRRLISVRPRVPNS